MISSELCQKAHRDLLRRRMKIFSDAGFVVPDPEGIIDQDRWSSENLRQLAHSVWAILKAFCCPCFKKPSMHWFRRPFRYSEDVEVRRKTRPQTPKLSEISENKIFFCIKKKQDFLSKLAQKGTIFWRGPPLRSQIFLASCREVISATT